MRAVLFDLDGTLLPMDIEKFMKLYFYEMGKVFEDVLDRDSLVDKVMKATKVMVMDVSDRTNEEVFMEAYENMIDENLALHREKWDEFYADGYGNVKVSSSISDEMVESVRLLKEKGMKIVLVTNPLFPKKMPLNNVLNGQALM